jgi:Restriction endonuclease
MRKHGRGFELVVAEVARAMEPAATVEQGVWVNGPDGRRELDVVITGEVDGQPRTVLVECKDFAPGRSVGIEYVDALDSKRDDLGLEVALLCCNAGFTAPAVRKAARVGIGLIGVMKRGDLRIRLSIAQTVYTALASNLAVRRDARQGGGHNVHVGRKSRA